MFVSFSILTITVIFFCCLQIYTKSHNKASVIYALSLITIFYTPTLYYFFGGEVYRFFSESTLITYTHISTFVFVIYSAITFFICSLNIKSKNITFKDSYLVNFYFAFFILVITLYYAVYIKDMPLAAFILTQEITERPDLTGNIPNFYTISSLVMIYLGSVYFYFFSSIKKKKLHIFINLLICFIFISSGHKGFIVYYFIFIWIFIFNLKFDIKIFLIFIVLMFVYMISKGITEINYDTLEYMANSPFRRFFVSQGAGFIHRIEMVSSGYYFNNPRGIKFDVFYHMYNTNITGSSPTFFMGDLYVKYNIFVSFLVFIFISVVISYLSRFTYLMVSNKKLFVYWNVYVSLYIISMAEITIPSSLRVGLALVNILIVYYLSRVKVK